MEEARSLCKQNIDVIFNAEAQDTVHAKVRE